MKKENKSPKQIRYELFVKYFNKGIDKKTIIQNLQISDKTYQRYYKEKLLNDLENT